MRKNALTKTMVLSGFIFLITIFLLYRMGKFNHYFQDAASISPAIKAGNTDSVKPVLPPFNGILKDSLHPTIMMSSSKSIIVMTPEQLELNKKIFADTANLKKTGR